MSVNGVTSATSTYEAYQTSQKSATKTAEETTTNNSTSTAEDTGVVYEKSNETATDSAKKTYTPNTTLVNKMKADAEARQKQLQSIVEKLLNQQGETYNIANDLWSILSGGKLEVDEATRLQAQKDIADDGYWGVEQTSDRIVDFAKALTGGDPDKIDEMREAFEKAYKQAEKTWGGELPDISKKTYEAVLAKFDKWAEEAASSTNAAADDTTEN